MKYVIPSYQRADILKTKTLCFLEKQGVSPEDVYIFIREDDPQAEDYASLAHPTTRYNINRRCGDRYDSQCDYKSFC